MLIRKITATDDAVIYEIIRASLEAHKLNILGTAYFDPELAHLSSFYEKDHRRDYFVVEIDGKTVGGAGFAPFEGNHAYAELQKLYLVPSAQGRGISYTLIEMVQKAAKKAGFAHLYLETHHNLEAATHVYRKAGFTELEGPLSGSLHNTMDLFFMKSL